MTHSITVNSFNSICRICLVAKNDMISTNSPMIICMLEYCTSIQETLNANLPQQICIDCHERLKSCFYFKQQYLISVQILTKIFQSENCVTQNETITQTINQIKEENNQDTENENTGEISLTEVFIKEEGTEIKNVTNFSNTEPNQDLKTKLESDCEKCNEEESDIDSFIDKTTEQVDELPPCKGIKKIKNTSLVVTCDICGKKLKGTYYPRHLKYHKNNKLYECDICHTKFKQSYNLKTHKRFKHGNAPKKICSICGKLLAEISLPEHLKLHEESKANQTFKCNFCDQVYTRSKSLHLHVRAKHSENGTKVSCKLCNKILAHKSYMRVHMRLVHSNVTGEHVCKFCNKNFKIKSRLNKHIKSAHLNERPHSCTVCNESFHTRVILKNHMRRHTGERPFLCTVCGKSFGYRVALKTHMKMHSRKKELE